MKKSYLSNGILAVVLAIALCAMILVRTFAPLCVLPGFTVANLSAVCLLALLLTHYLTGKAVSCDPVTLVLAVVTFGAMPLCGAFVSWQAAWKLGLLGGVVFFGLSFAFRQMMTRLQTGPAAKAAPALCALGLYLAMQCF